MLPLLLAAGSTLLTAKQGIDEGNDLAKAGAADMAEALFSSHTRKKRVTEHRERTLGTIRSRVGASGVELVGSPLEVLLTSAAQAERDLIISRRIGQNAYTAAQTKLNAGANRSRDALIGGMLNLGSAGVKAGKSNIGSYGGLDYGGPERSSDTETIEDFLARNKR